MVMPPGDENDDKMMAELFGESVIMESPILVTLCPAEVGHLQLEHDTSTLSKMLQEVLVRRPLWLGIRISGDLGARVSLQEGLAVGKACVGGLEESAVTLRVEKRGHTPEGKVIVIFACKVGNKQVVGLYDLN